MAILINHTFINGKKTNVFLAAVDRNWGVANWEGVAGEGVAEIMKRETIRSQ